jgi:hypothetical protein
VKIGPSDQLATGTKVAVNGKRGIVVGCEYVRAVPDGFISVHEIHFTSRYIHFSGARKGFYKPIDETRKVNYAFIEVL